jgi:tryptophanyl-tRNA synthetase
MTKKGTLLSGIAPSGRLTIGNYLGAIRNWVDLQDHHDCFFPLVDLHAITVRQDPRTFADRCRDVVALYIACGVDPNGAAVFAQSHVAQHCQLAWILQCHTQVGELNRMTQFKDKNRRNKGENNAGLFSYPVLMAADILLYKADLVPVGDDQRQHLELTRDLVVRLNERYGAIFPLPEAHIAETGARIMSLQDPTKKMSKSDELDANIVALLDPPEVVARKIRRCVTDSGNEIVVRDDKPGVSNLLNILSATTGEPITTLVERYREARYERLKIDVADALISVLEPIQSRFRDIRSNALELDEVLATGAAKARDRAQATLTQVHDALGLIAPR